VGNSTSLSPTTFLPLPFPHYRFPFLPLFPSPILPLRNRPHKYSWEVWGALYRKFLSQCVLIMCLGVCVCFWAEKNIYYQMSSFNESAGLGLLKTDAIEFVKYLFVTWSRRRYLSLTPVKRLSFWSWDRETMWNPLLMLSRTFYSLCCVIKTIPDYWLNSH